MTYEYLKTLKNKALNKLKVEEENLKKYQISVYETENYIKLLNNYLDFIEEKINNFEIKKQSTLQMKLLEFIELVIINSSEKLNCNINIEGTIYIFKEENCKYYLSKLLLTDIGRVIMEEVVLKSANSICEIEDYIRENM
jgi:hypothetical protein